MTIVYQSFQDLENQIGWHGIRRGGIYQISLDSLPASLKLEKGQAVVLTSNSPIGFTVIATIIIGTLCVIGIIVALTGLFATFFIPQDSKVIYKDDNKIIVANGDGTTTVVKKDGSAEQFGEPPLGFPMTTITTIVYVIIILAVVIILFYYALKMKKKGG